MKAYSCIPYYRKRILIIAVLLGFTVIGFGKRVIVGIAHFNHPAPAIEVSLRKG